MKILVALLFIFIALPFGLGLALLAALLKAWAVITIWQWKFAPLFPELASYVTMANVFYGLFITSLITSRYTAPTDSDDEDKLKKAGHLFAYLFLGPLMSVGLVWLLMFFGY